MSVSHSLSCIPWNHSSLSVRSLLVKHQAEHCSSEVTSDLQALRADFFHEGKVNTSHLHPLLFSALCNSGSMLESVWFPTTSLESLQRQKPEIIVESLSLLPVFTRTTTRMLHILKVVLSELLL